MRPTPMPTYCTSSSQARIASNRRAPRRPCAGGGCQHQHIVFERQRNMKTAQVQEMFEQLGGLLPHGFPPPVLDTIGTDKVFGYRAKITPHYDVPEPNKAPKRAQGRGNATTTSSTAIKLGPLASRRRPAADWWTCRTTTSQRRQ